MGEGELSLRRSGSIRPDSSFRSEYLRDRDRLYYTQEFRRLEGVTQVMSPSGYESHNRLTHSLRVEQVARSLASRFREKYPELDIREDVVMAASLAHDIGHPPFGHTGEEELHALLTCEAHRRVGQTSHARVHDQCRSGNRCLLGDGFEGNAQTLRIIAITGIRSDYTKSDKPLGFDLTRRVLAASTKYPWLRGDRPEKPRKWGAYDCDALLLSEMYQDSSAAVPTLEAQIMDRADDIAYAVHDLEDYFRAGAIPLGQIRGNTPSFEAIMEYLSAEDDAVMSPVLKKLVSEYNKMRSDRLAGNVIAEDSYPHLDTIYGYLELFPSKRFSGGGADIAVISRLQTQLTTMFIESLEIEDGVVKPSDDWAWFFNDFLKQLTWFYVIDSPDLSSIQYGQRRLIRTTFEALRAKSLEAWDRRSSLAQSKAERALPPRLVSFYEVGRKGNEVNAAESLEYDLEQVITRAVVDYIASLSDLELEATGRRFAGIA